MTGMQWLALFNAWLCGASVVIGIVQAMDRKWGGTVLSGVLAGVVAVSALHLRQGR